MFSDLRRPWRLAVAVFSIIAIAVSARHLGQSTDGLEVAHRLLASLPVTVFTPVASIPAPVIVIAHGFAGSQQLMQPFAITLARNGYVVLTFDFPGHGRNAVSLAGGLADDAARTRALAGALDTVVAYARTLPSGDGHLGLLGHSMASEAVVSYAHDHPEIGATVAVSWFSQDATNPGSRNLLVIDGALEPAMLIDQGYRIVAGAAHDHARDGVTYGSFVDGTARRIALAAGVEHIGVLYSADSMREALAWLNEAFDHRGSGYIEARGPWLGLLFAAIVALAWPLSGLLPRVAASRLGAGLAGRSLWLVAVAPAVFTPLILWRLPHDFLPILLGDYLVLHFGLYGLLTAAGILLLRPKHATAPRGAILGWMLALAIFATAAYAIVAFGWPLDRFAISFMPGPIRGWLIVAMLCGTLPYFLADEWLTRGMLAPRFGYPFTKVCFLVSLAIAVVLNLRELFFLIIIIPATLAFFVVYGLLSGWTYRQTNHPLVAASANALAFAWAIAVTFPIVGR